MNKTEYEKLEQSLDLEPRDLKLLTAIIQERIPDKAVWAYGSRVDHTAGSTSDLDLAVFGCSTREIADLKEALAESHLLVTVDVLDWESIPENFKENIKQKYITVQ